MPPNAYQYLMAASDAAIQIAAQLPATQTHYRGVSLAAAYVRSLYEWAENSQELLQAAQQTAVPFRKVTAPSPAHARLAAQLAPRARVTIKPPAHPSPSLASRLHSRLSRTLQAAAQPTHVNRVAQADLLVRVQHPSLVKYVTPVMEHLTLQSAVLVALEHDQKLIPTLAQQSVPTLITPAPPPSAAPATIDQQLRHLYKQIENVLMRTRPRAILMVEGSGITQQLFVAAARKLGIVSLCLQQGWSPLIHAGWRHLQFDAMYVWGDGFAQLLQPYNPQQLFITTGNHQLASQPPPLPQQLTISFFYQGEALLSPAAAWESFTQLVRWTAATFPSVRVIVREHPRWPIPDAARRPLERVDNIAWQPPTRYSLTQTLADSTITVGMWSTTILETIAMHRIPLIVNLTSLPRYHPDVATAGAGLEVNTLSAAHHALRRLVADESYRTSCVKLQQSFRQHFFAATGAAALANLTAHVSQAALKPA